MEINITSSILLLNFLRQINFYLILSCSILSLFKRITEYNLIQYILKLPLYSQIKMKLLNHEYFFLVQNMIHIVQLNRYQSSIPVPYNDYNNAIYQCNILSCIILNIILNFKHWETMRIVQREEQTCLKLKCKQVIEPRQNTMFFQLGSNSFPLSQFSFKIPKIDNL